MSDVEHIRSDSVEVVEQSATLYDAYTLKMADLGGGPVFLTPEGQGIFAGHIRMDKAQRLANLLGFLVEEQLRVPLETAVTVVDFGAREEMDENQSWIAGQAVRRTPNFVGVDDAWMGDLEEHTEIDEYGNKVSIHELEIPNSGFVSTYLGRTSCKVLLTPKSVFPNSLS